jgi:hypothetical protein
VTNKGTVVVENENGGMLYMYFILNGSLSVALGHGPDHLRQALSVDGSPPPRVFLGTLAPIGADEQAEIEKQYGLKPAPVVEVQLTPYRFRADAKPNAKYMKRLREGQERDAARKAQAPAAK